MIADLYLGFDIGTTEIKAGIFNSFGEELWEKSLPNMPLLYHGADYYEAENFLGAFEELLKEVPRPLLDDLAAIGLSSFAETVFPCDGEEIIYPGLAWYDEASKAAYGLFNEKIGPEKIRAVGGRSSSWMASGPHILKFKSDEPDLYKKTKYFLSASSVMAFYLCGEFCFDPTLAARTLLYNIKKRDWAPELFEAVGLDFDKIPALKNPGEVIGLLSAEAAAKLRLKPGLIISFGGMDHMASAFSSGIAQDSQALISIGTAAAFYSPAADDVFSQVEFLKRTYLAGGQAVWPGQTYMLGSLSSGGYCIDWFIHQVLKQDYAVLGQAPQYSPAFFFPNIRASADGLPEGGFYGLSDKDNAQTMLQAVIEGLAFESRYILERIFGLKKTPLQDICVVGGGALNRRLLKCLANLFGQKIRIPAYPKSGAVLGAAICGAIASGKNNFDDLRFMRLAGQNILAQEPHMKAHLDDKYHKYIARFHGE